MAIFFVRYQQHKYTDRSDNPNPRSWKIEATNKEEAFALAQQRAMTERAKGRNIGHVFREMTDEQGRIVVADGDYLTEDAEGRKRLDLLEDHIRFDIS